MARIRFPTLVLTRSGKGSISALQGAPSFHTCYIIRSLTTTNNKSPGAVVPRHTDMDIELARFNMIEQQIRTWEVLDQSVLDLLGKIHREVFVPESYRGLAFADIRIPLDHGQTMMMPKEEARVLQSLELGKDDTVLEIGTGSGYLTALLASTAGKVKSIDLYPDFTSSCHEKLARFNLTNVELETTDVYQLLQKGQQYDAVVLTASLPKMDERFLQLVKEGGSLFVIVGSSPVMEAGLIAKQSADSWALEGLFETDLPPLIGALENEPFQF